MKRPLYYTFGNHMHWVDMQWLWGYHVLPGSVADMLKLCRETGARGNVNFEGAGYEKMAVECPEALASLRAAVKAGTVEPVGCSYGQPYGLFQGGESNVRQLIYGVGSTCRMLGVRPATFWEEEFYCFPQLPQMLRSSGYTGACLFFQWTWHTPELPKEAASLIRWEGIDGSQLPALPRNDLNVHQWPEDFDGLLDQGLVEQLETPAVVQWLELMPSRDWMCRSELLLPRLKALMKDRRFDVRARTAGGVIAELVKKADEGSVPVRCYSPDQMWHGMTLGKNADAHPRASKAAESLIIAAEAISTTASLLGRPYPSWDVYPTWELEEAWRETLAAQHHDNHECEGLCGFVGHTSFQRAQRLASEVGGRAAWLVARRAGAKAGMAINPLGWARRVSRFRNGRLESGEVPPFGYAAYEGRPTPSPRVSVADRAGEITLTRGGLSVVIDRRTGTIRRLGSGKRGGFDGLSLLGLRMSRGGRQATFGKPDIEVDRTAGSPLVRIRRAVGAAGWVDVLVWIADETDAVDVRVTWSDKEGTAAGMRPDAGLNAAMQLEFDLPMEGVVAHADGPYSMQPVRGSGVCKRKYPEGDWMTSPQWFEEVRDPFTAQSIVDLETEDGSGLAIAHDGAQQWFRDENGVRVVLTAYDPWDEGRYTPDNLMGCAFRLVPHARAFSNAERVRLAAEFGSVDGRTFDDEAVPVGGGTGDGSPNEAAPLRFGAIDVGGAPGVLAHAVYRDSAWTGQHLPRWAGHEMARRSGGLCTHPTVVRLVEWNGEEAEVTLRVPGPLASAAKTNLLGEVGRGVGGGTDTGWLKVEPGETPAWAKGAKINGRPVKWSRVRFTMRAREIATIMLDVEMARKQWRDLDAKREVWAKIHKTKATAGAPARRGGAKAG